MKNSGVHVKVLTEGAADDFYGVIQHIYELEYNTTSYPKRVILFYCHWFDPTSRGTRVNPKYGTIEIWMDRSYNLFDLFISAHNLRHCITCHIQQQEGTSVVGVLKLKQSQWVT